MQRTSKRLFFTGREPEPETEIEVVGELFCSGELDPRPDAFGPGW